MAERISIDTDVPISGGGHVRFAVDIPDIRCMTGHDQRFVLSLAETFAALTGAAPDGLRALEGGR